MQIKKDVQINRIAIVSENPAFIESIRFEIEVVLTSQGTGRKALVKFYQNKCDIAEARHVGLKVPVVWGEAHLSQIHVKCLYNESSIAFHKQ